MMTPFDRAQQGKSLIKEAILDHLRSQSGRGLSRTEIETALGIESRFEGDTGGDSYAGALAEMFLTELVMDGKIEREKAGNRWVYFRGKIGAAETLTRPASA